MSLNFRYGCAKIRYNATRRFRIYYSDEPAASASSSQRVTTGPVSSLCGSASRATIMQSFLRWRAREEEPNFNETPY